MDKKPVDKTKKSNIYCAHCKHWCHVNTNSQEFTICDITHAPKNYWSRCKAFKWKEGI